jgi:hypothetical protein
MVSSRVGFKIYAIKIRGSTPQQGIFYIIDARNSNKLLPDHYKKLL